MVVMLTESMSKGYICCLCGAKINGGGEINVYQKAILIKGVLPWNKGKSTSAVPAYIFLGIFDFRQAQKNSTGVGTRIELRL
jgi:hypothetical protein